MLVIAAPMIAPYDPLEQNIQQPDAGAGAATCSRTDSFGRDVLAACCTAVGCRAAGAGGGGRGATLFGTVAARSAGYRGGILDEIVMRIADLVLAFPSIILAMAVVAALGGSMTNSVIAVAIVAVAPLRPDRAEPGAGRSSGWST